MPNIELKDISGQTITYENVNFVKFNTDQDEQATYVSDWIVQPQVQADWNAVQEEGAPPNPAVILNKPNIPNTADLLPEIEPEQDEGKILGVVNGEWQKTDMPEVPNVPTPDWTAEEGQPGYIDNKPTIPNPQVQTDWNAVAPSMAAILNKPTDLVNEQYVKERIKEILQSNWEELDETSKAFIQNKPFSRGASLIPKGAYTSIDGSSGEDGGGYAIDISSFGLDIEENTEYVVFWDGISYTLTCTLHEGSFGAETLSLLGIGNAGLCWSSGNQFIPKATSDLPFFINDSVIFTESANDYQVYICKKNDINQIDKVYIPREDILVGMASQSYVQDQIDAIPRPDWNQNSSSSNTYIKNRPFYTEDDLIKEQTLSFTSSSNHSGKYSHKRAYGSILEKDGNTSKLYTVEFDGIIYENCVCRDVTFRKSGNNYLYTIEKVIGDAEIWDNGTMYTSEDKGKGLPFVFALRKYYSQLTGVDIDMTCITTKLSGSSHKIRVYTSDHIHKIDSIYLPDSALANSDWNAKAGEDGFIANKPIIPEAQVQANWAQTDTEAVDYILNKPEAPVQSDYDQLDSRQLDFIKNKIVGYKPDIVLYNVIPFTKTEVSGYYKASFEFAQDPSMHTNYNIYFQGNTYKLNHTYYDSTTGQRIYGFGNPSLAIVDGKVFIPDYSYNVDIPFFVNTETSTIFINSQVTSTKYGSFRITEVDNIIKLESRFLKGSLLPEISEISYVNPYITWKNGEWIAGEFPKSDWKETNSLSVNFISNKPFGTKNDYLNGEGAFFNKIEEYYAGMAIAQYDNDLISGVKGKIKFNESSYEVTCKKGTSYDITTVLTDETGELKQNTLVLGNVSLLKHNPFISNFNSVDSGEDYCFVIVCTPTEGENNAIIFSVTKTEYTKLDYKRNSVEYAKIDKKYLPDDLVIPTDKTLSKIDSPADAQVVGKKIQEVKTSVTEIDKRIKLGTEYAGQLVYVGEDGYPSVLRLGRGLSIKNGVLMVVEATETTSELDVGTLDTMVLPEE